MEKISVFFQMNYIVILLIFSVSIYSQELLENRKLEDDFLNCFCLIYEMRYNSGQKDRAHPHIEMDLISSVNNPKRLFLPYEKYQGKELFHYPYGVKLIQQNNIIKWGLMRRENNCTCYDQKNGCLFTFSAFQESFTLCDGGHTCGQVSTNYFIYDMYPLEYYFLKNGTIFEQWLNQVSEFEEKKRKNHDDFINIINKFMDALSHGNILSVSDKFTQINNQVVSADYIRSVIRDLRLSIQRVEYIIHRPYANMGADSEKNNMDLKTYAENLQKLFINGDYKNLEKTIKEKFMQEAQQAGKSYENMRYHYCTKFILSCIAGHIAYIIANSLGLEFHWLLPFIIYANIPIIKLFLLSKFFIRIQSDYHLNLDER